MFDSEIYTQTTVIKQTVFGESHYEYKLCENLGD